MAAPSDSQWGRVTGLGLEMAVAVGLGYFVGHWLDGRYDWNVRATIIGTCLGIAGGMYLVMKQAIQLNKD
ncbi:MAG: AtpZ/AtpI family protein [Tepidisphaeraceae bacterium]|jgi:F0F1-type ATP synthase assembly protein I